MLPANDVVSAAAKGFYSTILGALKNDQGVHAETAIAAASRMAGTFLFRSFNFPLKDITPGSAVLSDIANEKGPMLVELLGKTLQGMKVAIDSTRVEAAMAKAAKPHLSVVETQELLESELESVKKKFQLTHEQAAYIGAFTSAMFVRDCAGVLDPNAGFGIAAYGFVEGAKTAPAPPVAPPPRKPWYKVW